MSSAHYTPAQVVKDFHNLPRYGGGGNDLSGAFSSGFEVSKLTSNQYLIGVLGPGAALIAAGVLVFVIFFLAYCCACCRCCGRCKPREQVSTTWKLLSRNTALLVIGVINLALILSAISYVPGFGDGMAGIVGAVKSVAELMKNGVALLTSNVATPPLTISGVTGIVPVLAQITGATQGFNGLQGVFCNNPSSPNNPFLASAAPCTVFTTQSSILTAVPATISTAAAPLSTASDSFGSSIDAFPVDSIKGTITQAGLIVLAVVSGVIFLQSIILCRNRCASISFRWLSFLSLLMSALVYIVAGIFFIVGVIGSDVCYDPYTVVSNLVSNFDPTGTIKWYLTCATAGPAVAPAGTVNDMVTGIASNITGLATTLGGSITLGVDGALNTIANSVMPALQKAQEIDKIKAFTVNSVSYNTSFAGMVGGLTGAGTSLGQFSSVLLSCSAMDGIFSQFFNGFCGGAITSSINVARVMIAAASLLLIQLCLITDFSCYHPGDAGAWKEGDAKGAPAATATTLRAPVAVPASQNPNYTPGSVV